MKENKVSKYTIQLDIERSDEAAKNIDEIERALKDISEAAKDINITEGLKSASIQADKLAEKVKNVALNSEDSTKELQAYDKAAQKSIQELEKQYIKLNYSLSEQGTAQRKQLEQLKEEAETLEGNTKERKRYNQILKEIKDIEKSVYSMSDDELKTSIQQNKEVRAKLKFTQTEAKLAAAQRKSQVSFGKLLKDDIKGMKEKVAQQLKFIQALKTTEGRYNAIKKAASKIGMAGISGGKAALKGIAGIGAGALALGGSAIASASTMEEREKQARRIKGAFTDEEKNEILGDLYIKTGADYSTIVEAINRVRSVLGNVDRTSLIEAATAEVRYPGAAAMFRQDNKNSINSADFSVYANRLKAVQGATGASVEQVEASTQKIANLRQSAFSNASMTELQALYLGLQNSGAYDTQEELDRVFARFVRQQRGQKESVFDFAKTFDWSAGVWGAQNKTQAKKAISNIDFSSIQSAVATTTAQETKTGAQITAENLRKMEEQKTRLMIQILNSIYPVFEKLNTDDIQKVFKGLMDFALKVVPPMIEILNAIAPYIEKIISGLNKTLDKIYEYFTQQTWGPNKQPQLVDSFANGGLATMPSLVGEAGPEMVIPLDHSRAARAGNLTQYYNQNFSMSGNETTALSLSQVVRTRGFARAINTQNDINTRLGR